MKPFAQARLLRDFCDFYSPVSNTWQSLMKYQQRKKQKFPGKNFRVFFQIHFGDKKKRVNVQYDKFDIFFSRFITTRHWRIDLTKWSHTIYPTKGFEVWNFAFCIRCSKTKIYKLSRIEEINYAHKDGNMWAGIILYFEQRFVNCLVRLSLQPFSFDKTRETCMYLIV